MSRYDWDREEEWDEAIDDFLEEDARRDPAWYDAPGSGYARNVGDMLHDTQYADNYDYGDEEAATTDQRGTFDERIPQRDANMETQRGHFQDVGQLGLTAATAGADVVLDRGGGAADQTPSHAGASDTAPHGGAHRPPRPTDGENKQARHHTRGAALPCTRCTRNTDRARGER